MRILFTTHQFFPEGNFGIERFTLNIASAMQRAGHKVHVATYCNDQSPFGGKKHGILYRNYSYRGIPVTALKFESSWANLCLDTKPSLRLFFAKQILSQGNYDLLHAANPMGVSSSVLAAIQCEVPYLITVISHLSFCYRPKVFDPRNEAYGTPRQGKAFLRFSRVPKLNKAQLSRRISLEKRILSHAAGIVSPSLFIASELAKEHPRARTTIISHGGASIQAPFNDKRYSKQSRLTFGFMGRIMPSKGVHLLIQAFRKIKNPDCGLRIYGLGYHDYMLELLKLAHGDKRIAFCGPYSSQEEASSILRQIDVLCFPSLAPESYGIVIEEALAARVPVLASRVGAVRERIRDGVHGFTVELARSQDFYGVMNRIVENPALLNTLKKNIISYTTIEEEAAQYESLYRSILNRG